MSFVSDNAIDAEIQKTKIFIEGLKQRQTTFSNSFHLMAPKDRARLLKQIQADHKTVMSFLERAKKSETINSGTKFGIENIKQSFQTLMTLWRKTEKNLENFTSGSAPKQMDADDGESKNAVEKYVIALRNLGHTPSNEMISEFKDRLDSAYQRAKEQSGGKELSIQIVQDGSKIKVRMEPK